MTCQLTFCQFIPLALALDTPSPFYYSIDLPIEASQQNHFQPLKFVESHKYGSPHSVSVSFTAYVFYYPFQVFVRPFSRVCYLYLLNSLKYNDNSQIKNGGDYLTKIGTR